MSWQNLVRPPLRVLLNDIDSELYSNNTLDQLSFTAAALVIQEVKFSTNYQLDYSLNTVTPDPSNDTEFINFVVLKSACLKGNWDFNTRLAIDGVKAKMGPLDINVNGAGSQALLALLNEGPCKMYKELVMQYNCGRVAAIKAIFGPFSHEDLTVNR